MTKFIVRTVETRDISNLIAAVPDLIIVRDRIHDAMETYLRAMEVAGDDPCVQLEDDLVLCSDFYNRVNAVIAEHPDDIIQFFSMRKDDLTLGTRYIPGSRFMANLCFYLPAGLAKEFREYARQQGVSLYKDTNLGCDGFLAAFLKSKKMKYLNIVPNLVDHQVAKSAIDPRRSSKRQSLTFRG